jgi:RNA recognition motif-containing protein
MSKVFVGDLSFEQNEESLRQIMAEYGVVIDAQVCVDKDGRPKGYGFVVFSDETSAELACTAAKQRGQRVWRVRSPAPLCVTPRVFLPSPEPRRL